MIVKFKYKKFFGPDGGSGPGVQAICLDRVVKAIVRNSTQLILFFDDELLHPHIYLSTNKEVRKVFTELTHPVMTFIYTPVNSKPMTPREWSLNFSKALDNWRCSHANAIVFERS